MAKRKRYEDHMLLAAGEQVTGNGTSYIIDQVAGMGSFGAVYKAHDPGLPDRRVALKEFYAPRHPRDRASLDALFEREFTVGQIASPHPLMPTFYDAFTTEGLHYIAQEFVEGATLDEIIFKRHPLPREWTLKWAVSLCDALAFLHSRGVVHHDLKPANIRISPQGHLTLLDFGGAQYFGKDHEKDQPVEIYGTEGYLPPELEADGQWIADARTDIFAVGCILYEMIAGVAPDQETINERSMYVTNSLMQQPNADLALISLINKALSYNTDYRYASANEFLLDVRRIAPPVLLVSRKHLRFGELRKADAHAPLEMTIYNAGGQHIQGEVKPRAAWIIAHPSRFDENRQDVMVSIDASKIIERGVLTTGQLEINSRNVMNANGEIVSQGDRWFVECSVTIQRSAGELSVLNGAPAMMTGRRGQTAAGSFTLQNTGEQPLQYTIPAGIDFTVEGQEVVLTNSTIEPLQKTLLPNTQQTVLLKGNIGPLPVGVYSGKIQVTGDDGKTLTVPVALHVQSPFEMLRAVLGKRSG